MDEAVTLDALQLRHDARDVARRDTLRWRALGLLTLALIGLGASAAAAHNTQEPQMAGISGGRP